MILIGSYIDSVSQADPVSMTRLMKGLDEFLEHDQDRALFDLARPTLNGCATARSIRSIGTTWASLRPVWSRALLVRDGVMFMPNPRDTTQAIDAVWTQVL